MRNLLVFFLFAVLTCVTTRADVIINSTTFPDAVFRSYVTTKVAGASDGKLTNAELSKVTSINVEKLGISTLTGIEYFTSLKKLVCGYNNLKNIDLSANTKLTYLGCYHNQLTEIDLSRNTLLDTLSFLANKLTSIDLSKQPNLIYLNVAQNELTSLDITKNTKIARLLCAENILKELDLSNNTELSYLSCYTNSIGELDLKNNAKLTDVIAYCNMLTYLDVSSCTLLSRLWCKHNSLTNLDINHNTKLVDFLCNNNHILQIKGVNGLVNKTWDTSTFSADQNVVMSAELMKINGESKYVISMPKSFIDKVTLNVCQVEKVNNINGQNGTFFVINPDEKPASFTFRTDYSADLYYSVAVNVDYKAPTGDVNGDGRVDVDDVNAVIEKILK